jgi:hypothetical protein
MYKRILFDVIAIPLSFQIVFLSGLVLMGPPRWDPR